MAAAVVRDPAVRGAFRAIGWVSVGQNPSILEMQRILYHQLALEPMRVKEGTNVAMQLHELQAACMGKTYLVCLDDVWDCEHEVYLNCVDPASASKILVTTRIRGLPKSPFSRSLSPPVCTLMLHCLTLAGLLTGCNEISLNLLSPGESVDLLLRLGAWADKDDEAKAAALEIASLCGHLPLYLGERFV